MERWQNKVAVVTGASLGIGAAIAKDLVKAGVQVVGLARRREGLEKVRDSFDQEQQSLFTSMQCDVSDLQSVNETFNEIIRIYGGVDILINNAGKLVDGMLVQTDPHLIGDMLTTGVMGIVYCTQRAFKSMKERNVDGHVILMNGISGHTPICGIPIENPVIHANIITVSKYPVTAMTEIYRQEFFELGTGVKITSISPGLVDTTMPNEDIRQAMQKSILSPQDVSNAVLFCLSTPPHVQISELTIRPVGDLTSRKK